MDARISLLSPLNPGLAAPPGRTSELASRGSPAPLGQASKEFEAVFASVLLKELRQCQEGGLFPGDRSDALGSIFDLHMGRVLASGGFLPLDQQWGPGSKASASQPPTLAPGDGAKAVG
jgi:hypothetical protein